MVERLEPSGLPELNAEDLLDTVEAVRNFLLATLWETPSKEELKVCLDIARAAKCFRQ